MLAQYLPPLYVAALYWSSRLVAVRGNPRQQLVIDAMAVNWLACELAALMVGYARVPPAFMVIDVASALWLSYHVRGRVAGMAQVFYIAMILWNAAFFFRGDFTSGTHWWGLSVLSWGQLAFVAGGIMRHDLAKPVHYLAARSRVFLHLGVGKKEPEK